MKKIISTLLIAAMVVALVLSITSCGKKDDAKEFIVVTNCPFEPFEYVGDDGKIYGLDIEIAALYAEAKGYKLVIKNIPFDSIFTEVDAGYATVGMAGITVSADRAAIYGFSDTYYNASQKVIVKADDTTFDACTTAAEVEDVIASLDNGTKFGYQNGTVGGMYVNGDEDWEFDGFENLVGTGYATAQDAANDMLANGTVAAVVVDGAPAAAIVAASSGALKLIDIDLTEEEYAFCFKKGSTEIADFNAFLTSIKEDGTFDALVDKYFKGTGTKVGQTLAQ